MNYTFILDITKTSNNNYIWVFSVNVEGILLLAFIKYMLYSYCTESCIFCTFWGPKTLVLGLKIVQNLLIFVYLFCLKNSTIHPRKTSITQLSHPLLSRIFNALSIGEQYTLLFQWNNFGLKCLLKLINKKLKNHQFVDDTNLLYARSSLKGSNKKINFNLLNLV